MASERAASLATSLSASGQQETGSGARWRRVDLHLHSPGVESFRCPDGADIMSGRGRQEIVKAYVDQLRKSGVDVAAVADYNGIREEWFVPIRDEARKHGILVLPGVEVAFQMGKHGLHVLAIFDESTEPGEVNSMLQAMDKDAAKPLFGAGRKHRTIDSEHRVADALKDLRERFGCLLIPAHPGETNGFCKSLQTKAAAEFIGEILPDALEHCPPEEVHKLQSTGVLKANFFENLSMVEFSDAHGVDEIGTKRRADGMPRSTYLKLSAMHLEALRLALHDPGTRLCIGNVKSAVHPRVRRFAVSGSGFLGNLNVEWNDDLNVIIGGRGVGKSAVLETLRYAVDMKAYSDHSYRSELVRHALGSGGKAEVLLERPLGNGKTRQYTITRVWGEEPRVVEVESGKPVSIPPSDLLGPNGGPTIFGQREIYAVSGSQEYRLALLDDLIGEKARERALEVRESIDLLRGNARSALDVRVKLAKRDEHRQRLKAIEHEIGIYEKHGAAEKLREATRLGSDTQYLRGARDAVSTVRDRWAGLSGDLLSPLETANRGLLRGQSRNKAILEDAAKVVGELRNGLERALTEARSLIDEAESRLKEVSDKWEEALRPLQEEINRIKQEAQTEALDPDRLLKLNSEQTGLAPLIEELDRSEDDLNKLEEKRQTLLEEVRQRRYAEHEMRREKAERIGRLLHGRLRLDVEFKGNKEEYKKRISTLLKGSGVSQDGIDRLVAPEATDGIALAEAAQAGAGEVQERFGVTTSMAERLVGWLTGDESRLFEVQTLIPGDSLGVELRVDDGYRPLDLLSAGQRATAILLLLFALEGRVLILDQPEDDLDNRFVYEDIVQMLRDEKGLKGKRRRQIIAATHNANIPVLGDAELVLTLEAREGRAHVVGRASIDDLGTRELIKMIMEGGEEAFLRRAQKYGRLRALQ